MELIRKYFWVILIAVAFLLGLLMSGGKDEELREKFEKEREESGKIIAEKEKEIERLREKGEEIRVRAVEDSIRFSKAIHQKETNINTLENQIKKANYRNARARDLDSLRRILLGTR